MTEPFGENTAEIAASYRKNLVEVASTQHMAIRITEESEKLVKTIYCVSTKSMLIVSKLIQKPKGPPPGFEQPAQPNVAIAQANDQKLWVLSVASHSADFETTTACVDNDQDDRNDVSQAKVEHVFAEFSLSNTPYIEDIDRPHEQEPCAPISSSELKPLGVLFDP